MFYSNNPRCYNPVEQHRVETLGGSAFSPVVPVGAQFLMVQAVTQNIRMTLYNGTVPTAAIGFQLVASAAPIVIPLAHGITPQFFREAGGAILQYQFLGNGDSL